MIVLKMKVMVIIINTGKREINGRIEMIGMGRRWRTRTGCRDTP